MMKTKKIRKILALTLITAMLGSFMNLSSISAQTLDKSLPQTSKSESNFKVKVTETPNSQGSGIVQLNDGETITVPLKMLPIKTTDVSSKSLTPIKNLTSGKIPNNGDITFSRLGGTISYKIVIYDFYTNLIGTESIMNHTNWQSGGVTPLTSSTGSVSIMGIPGHYYVLTVEGIAYRALTPVDSFYAQAGWTSK